MDLAVEEFALALVRNVRDEAVRGSDMNLKAGTPNQIARRWRESMHAGNPEELARMIIPDIVDGTIASFLRCIDQRTLRISYTTSNGEEVDLCTEGMGELVAFIWEAAGGDRNIRGSGLLMILRICEDFTDQSLPIRVK